MEITSNPISLDPFFHISKGNVEKRIGYTADADVSPRISSLIKEYIEIAKSLIDPSYSYRVLTIQQVKESVVYVDGPLILESTVIGRVLRRCNQVAVFALTIGHRLETMTAQLGEKGLILEAFILDAIGSSMTEKAADFVQGIIGEMAHLRDSAISRRFSPGYCDWDISQQQGIFSALENCNQVITLSEDFLMTPEKSVSGIIGIGPQDSNISTYTPCKECEKKTCLWRRT